MTLKQIQALLRTQQHVLIHLCEKGVVQPDIADTWGRGTRREFSRRNVFEFAIALTLRRLQLPVATTAMIVGALRCFTRTVNKAAPSFSLPESLIDSADELVLSLYEGELLVLHAAGPRFRKPLLLAAKLTGTEPRVSKLYAPPASYEARLDVNLSEIARKTFSAPSPK
jgi:hypothetical protein